MRPLLEVDHGDEVVGVAIDPAGTRLATAGRDRMVRVWPASDTQSGRADEPLYPEAAVWSEPSESPVEHAAFSPDAALLATAGGSGAQLWSMKSRSVLETVLHIPVTALAFDSDGQRLATAGGDGHVKVWRLADVIGADASRTLHQWLEPEKDIRLGPGQQVLTPVSDVAFGSDGRWIATVQSNGALAIRSLAQNVELWAMSGAATCVAAAGIRLATGDASGAARVFTTEALTRQDDNAFGRLELRTEMRTDAKLPKDEVIRPWCVVDHGAPISALAMSADGRTLVTAGADASVACWDVRRREVRDLGRLPLEDPVVVLDLAENAPLLATATGDTCAQVWDLNAFS
jgi:WD40 repeat protein